MIPARDPRYFGPTDRPLFGWIHRAPAPPHLGLVVCSPFGYEAVCAHRKAAGIDGPLFLGIDKARFRRPVTPGDRLDLSATVLQRRSNVWRLRGEARVDGALAAEAVLLASEVSAASASI